jgi:hypothetical protein
MYPYSLMINMLMRSADVTLLQSNPIGWNSSPEQQLYDSSTAVNAPEECEVTRPVDVVGVSTSTQQSLGTLKATPEAHSINEHDFHVTLEHRPCHATVASQEEVSTEARWHLSSLAAFPSCNTSCASQNWCRTILEQVNQCCCGGV